MKCLEAFSKGFVVGGEIQNEPTIPGMQVSNDSYDGILRVYEKTDEKSFHKAKHIAIEKGGVRSITISPSEETLVVTTRTSQLYKLSLVSSELFTSEVITPRPITPTFGHTKETHPHTLRLWLHDPRPRRASW